MKKSFHLIIFFISMALLESAVVVYLRELYYPNGFMFPLSPMKSVIILTELARELATIIMLWTMGYIAGRNFSTRFAWFIIGFGIWDIFYYVFLYIFIQWPATLVDWDILFLIPLPWYGPVIAPCLISVLMIIFGGLILYFNQKNKVIWKMRTLLLFLFGCVMGLSSFMEEFIRTLKYNDAIDLAQNILIHSQSFIPKDYSYLLLSLATLFYLSGIFIFYRNNLSKLKI
ncbi:MAG: hypothetical protein ACK5UE_08300 [Chitinophagales bacterium]|jgi:hypothetical protein|nr:hypothetical protein [Sphingobacteriales bacterium]